MAKIVLNSKLISGLKAPAEGVDEYFDDRVRGLILRVYSSGKKTWSIRSKRGTKKKRLTIGDAQFIALVDARTMALKILSDNLNLSEEDFIKKPEYTFEQLCNEYLERHAKIKKRSWKEDERKINKELIPVFGGRMAHEITRREVIEFLDDVFDEGFKVKVNRTHELIRKIFNFGVDREILDSSPCVRIPKLAEEATRDRVLSQEELIKILTAISKLRSPMKDLFQFYLMCGQRGKEVKFSEKSNFDFQNKVWLIPASIAKNKRDHRLPLTEEMMPTLQSAMANSRESKWMFPSPRLYRRDGNIRDEPILNIQKTIARIRKLSQVNFNGHDFRRTMTTWLASQSVPRTITEKLLNHTDNSVTSVYDRYDYMKEKREALEKWNLYLKDLPEQRLGPTPSTPKQDK